MNLTAEEYRQLEGIKVLYPWAKWVARDKNFRLYVYEKQPLKCEIDFCFNNPDGGNYGIVPKENIPSLTWESEPLNIDEALEGRGCEYCDKEWGIPDPDTGRFWEQDINLCPHCGRRLECEE